MDAQRNTRPRLGHLLVSRSTRRRTLKGAAAAIVGAVIAASAVVPAQAATGDVSQAEGLLLSGSGIVNVGNIAQLQSAYSSTNATTSAGAVSNPLNLTAVNALGVNLGNGVQLLGNNGLLTLGVAGQYGNTSATSAVAASGVVGSDGSIAVGAGTPGNTSTLNLTPLLSRVGASTTVASAAELDLGALASRIQSTRATGATSSSYGIASAKFQVTSPAIAGLNTSLQTTVNGIGSSLNNAVADPTALNGVVSGTTGGLTTALNTLGLGVLSLNGTALTVNLTGLNLGAVTAPVLAQTYTSGPVTINPSTGSITIDLNTLQALNGQPANTKLLSTTALQNIVTAAIQDILVTQIPAALNTAVVNAIGNATLNATLTAKIRLLGGDVANLNVAVTTSLGNLLKTTGRAPLTVNASATAIGALGLNISSAVLNPVLQPVVDGTLAPLLQGLVSPTVNAIPATLAATTTVVNTTVAPLLGILNSLVSITVNAQDSAGFQDSRGDTAGSRSVHALQLSVLPALNAATVNLATSTVNAAPIAALAVTTPTAGQQFTVATSTSTRSITVSGTGEPGATIAVDLGAGRTGSATVAADGSWTTTIAGVGVGDVTASVTQTFGGVTGAAVTRAFSVVAQAPLTITAPTAGRTYTVVSSSATTPVTLTGTATAGATVAIDLGGGITGSTTAAADGTWSATIPTVPVGSYTASVTQTIGGTTSAAVTRAFSVAAGAPLTVTAPTDGTQIVVPGSSSTTTVTVTGTAQPGATVAASLGTGLTGTATAAADGSYSIPITGVGVGTYTASVTQTVAGTASAAITRSVSVIAASPLVIQTPVAGASIPVAGPLSTTPVTVSGTAQAGASVTVQLAAGTTATTTAGLNGSWSTTFPAVGVGSYTASATQTVAGATSAAVTRAFSVTAGDPVVIQTPATGTITTVADAGSTRTVAVSGTAQAGASVVVTLKNGTTSTVTASGTGAWSTSFPNVGVGDYSITATQTVNGTTSLPVTSVYSIVAGAPVAITAPAPGATVVVAGAGLTAGVTVSGTAQPNASVAIDLGGGLTATTTASATGAWTHDFTGVAIGTHTISVTQTIGGTTSPAVTQQLTVAAGDPVAITSPASGASVTVFGADGTTNVVVSGTAQAGASVTASLGSGRSQTTTATAAGTWTATIPNVPVGDYQLGATQTINGSTSATLARPFSVVEGSGIVIQSPATGTEYHVASATSLRPTTTVSGVAADGATVVVTLDSGQTQTVTASGTGAWSVDFANLPVHDYTVNARQTVGGVSADATATTFRITQAAPLTIAAPTAGTVYQVASGTATRNVTVSGTAQAGATVNLTADGRTVTTTASASGAWSVLLDGSAAGDGSGPGLGVDTYAVTATQTVGGTTSTTPVATGFEIAAGAPFTQLTPIDGSTILVADADATQTIVVSGAGQPGASVAVVHAGTTRTVQVGLDGTWSASFPGVGVGDQTFTSTETVGGTTAGPLSSTVTIEAAPAVEITTPAAGASIMVAGPAATTDVTVTGAAAPNSSVRVDLGGGNTETVTTSPAGVWTATFADLAVGPYTVSATQTLNGTTSAPVASAFSIVAAAPVVIEAPVDGSTLVVADADSVVGVPVSGTAFPGAEVSVDIDGTVRTTTADDDGSWSVTIPGVDVGTHDVDVTQTIAGTTSAAVTVSVTVAAGAPVTITTPRDDSTVTVADADATASIPVSGTAQPGASVRVTLDGAQAKTVTADSSGNWSTSFTGVAVSDDPHRVAATQTVLGTTSAAVTADVTVEAGAPVTITSPEDGDSYIVANDQATTDVEVTGTAEPGATVTAETVGGIAATATADDDGSYTLTLQDVPTGNHTISVTQTVGGTTTADPATVDIQVGTAEAVTITSPAAGADLTVATTGQTVDVPVSGTAQPNADITVDLGGGLTATTTADGTGAWSATVEDVPVGDHVITVVQTVGGADSAPVTREISVSAADPVVVDSPTSGASFPVATAVSTTTVPVSGTAEPGTEVRVTVQGTTKTVTSGSDGSWSTSFPGITTGSHTASVVEVLDNGPTVPVVVAFTVDVAPALVITTPQDDQVIQLPLGTLTATVPVTGTGQPGATVTTTLDGGQTKTTTVGDDGTWTVSYTGVVALPTAHTVTATQSLAGVSQPSVDVSFTVEQTLAPADPVVIESPTPGTVIADPDGDGLVDVPVSGTGEPGSTITVNLGGGHTATTTVADDGTWSVTVQDVPVGPITVTVTQRTDGQITGSDSVPVSAATVAPAAITAPDDGDNVYVSDDGATADVTVSGTGEPGADIAIDLGGGLTATTTVGSDGTWTATVEDVPVGDHTVSVVETANGTALDPVTVDISVEVAAPVAIASPADGGTVTQATSPAGLPVTGTAQPGAEVTVTLDGGTPRTVTAGTDGTWAVTFPDVDAGDHEIQAAQELADGTTTPVTSAVTVREAAPAVILTPTDDQQIQIATGSTANLVVTGTGEPGASVKVTLNGVPAKTVTVSAQGTWTATFDDVAPGSRSVTATQTVQGTAQDPVKTTFTVVERATPVAAPTITSPAAGQIVRDADGDGFFDVTVTGTGQPGSTILVDAGSGLTRTVTVASNGTWTATVTAIPDGQRTLQVTQTTGSAVTGSAAVTITGTRAAPIVITAPTAGQNLSAGIGGTASTTVSGTAEPGATITVRLDNGSAITTTAASDGTWSVPLTGVATGAHTITATETVGIAVSAPASVAFTVVAAAPAGAIRVLKPSDNALIADFDHDGHHAIPISGTGTPGALITVDLDNGTIQTTTVGIDGTWTVTFATVPDGEHTFIASQTVAGVTTSAPEQSFRLEDHDPLVVASPAPGSSFVAGTDGTATVGIHGTAEPGATVTIVLDDGRTVTVTADSDGNWSASFARVAQGRHTYTVTQSLDGAVSDPETTSFTVRRNLAINNGGGNGGGTGGGNGGGTGSGTGSGSGTGVGTGSGTGNGAGTGTGSGSDQHANDPASLVERGLAYTGSVVLPWAAVGAGVLALGLGMLGASRGLSRIRARNR